MRALFMLIMLGIAGGVVYLIINAIATGGMFGLFAFAKWIDNVLGESEKKKQHDQYLRELAEKDAKENP